MTWYTGHYGSWANGGTVSYIDGTYNKEEMLAEAQRIANEKNVVVTVHTEKPNGHGLSVDNFKVYPTER